MRLNNSEDTASKLVVSILYMESFFGFILSDSMIFNSFFNYTFICKKLVSELRRFGTTASLGLWSKPSGYAEESRFFILFSEKSRFSPDIKYDSRDAQVANAQQAPALPWSFTVVTFCIVRRS